MIHLSLYTHKKSLQSLTFALVALFVESPHELGAVGAEDGLPEELGNELVTAYLVYLLVLDGTSAPGDAAGAALTRSILRHLFCGNDAVT